jgi:hypothetical protein
MRRQQESTLLLIGQFELQALQMHTCLRTSLACLDLIRVEPLGKRKLKRIVGIGTQRRCEQDLTLITDGSMVAQAAGCRQL